MEEALELYFVPFVIYFLDYLYSLKPCVAVFTVEEAVTFSKYLLTGFRRERTSPVSSVGDSGVSQICSMGVTMSMSAILLSIPLGVVLGLCAFSQFLKTRLSAKSLPFSFPRVAP